jgi:hypothetical protein
MFRVKPPRVPLFKKQQIKNTGYAAYQLAKELNIDWPSR